MYFVVGVLMQLSIYKWVLRSPWLLAIAGVCTAQCVVLRVALRLARRGRNQQSITLVCIGNWATVSLVTPLAPDSMPVMLLLALVPVVFAEPYVSSQRGLVFTLITVG